MKKVAIILSALMITVNASSQSREFEVYENGLIYNEETMGNLSRIVDSLNLQFKQCELNKVYYSKQQTVGHLIKLDTGNIKAAFKDIERNIPFEEFLKKYPDAKVQKELLIVKFKYKNYEDTEFVEIEHIDLKSSYGFSIHSEDLSLYSKKLQYSWLPEYHEKTSYSKENLKAFYFPNEFESIALPKQYAMMIGYSDCLIDTTITKLKEDLESGSVELPKNWNKLSDKKQKALLEEMRSTRVIGFCSMDSRPREHAINIALLSAETANWEVFLKAHLDIMNDRFDRVSDGSYAWAQRNTYIKELEELNINVHDLLFGISFRIENPAKNHYYGSIGRLGRALAETENPELFEDRVEQIIADDQLDDFNRILFYYLLRNYYGFIEDEKQKLEKFQELASIKMTLPDYLSRDL